MSQNITLSATISPAQGRAVEALAGGSTVTAAAEAAGVARETVSRWVHHDPVFIAELHNTRSETAAQTRCALEGLGMRAIATLGEALEDQRMRPTRLRAACAILKMLGADRAETLPPTSPLEVQLRLREHEDETRGRQTNLDAREENFRFAAYRSPDAEPEFPETAATEAQQSRSSEAESERFEDTSSPQSCACPQSGPGEQFAAESARGAGELEPERLLPTEEDHLRGMERIISGNGAGSVRERSNSSRMSPNPSTSRASSRITPRIDSPRAQHAPTQASQSCRKAW